MQTHKNSCKTVGNTLAYKVHKAFGLQKH